MATKKKLSKKQLQLQTGMKAIADGIERLYKQSEAEGDTSYARTMLLALALHLDDSGFINDLKALALWAASQKPKPTASDLTGQRFGQLTVIGKANAEMVKIYDAALDAAEAPACQLSELVDEPTEALAHRYVEVFQENYSGPALPEENLEVIFNAVLQTVAKAVESISDEVASYATTRKPKPATKKKVQPAA